MNSRNIALILGVIAVAGVIFLIEARKPKAPSSLSPVPISARGEININTKTDNKTLLDKKIRYAEALELVSPDGYLNTKEGLTLKSLIGEKVILIDFWTYSCINCQRTLPYLTAWHKKYRDEGLEIVGVHTPEFDFEKKKENVEKAIKQWGIEYPVIQDNNYFTWNAYRNRYWPRKYLIDIDGFIVYDHIGEGAYDETEKKIQEALRERAERLGMEDKIAEDMVSPENVFEVDSSKVKSPEIYFGAWRNERLGNGVKLKVGSQSLQAPNTPLLNALYLAGDWSIMQKHAENTSKGAKIIFRYNSKDVYFVASSEKAVKVRIMKNGKPLTLVDKGEDVSADSAITIQEERLYKLIQNSDYGEHTLEMIIESPGLEAFTFTFG